MVNSHSGGGGMPDYGPVLRRQGSCGSPRTTFFSRRPVMQMIVGGAFERFPDLRFVTHRTGCILDRPDAGAVSTRTMRQMARVGRIGELKYDPDDVLAADPERVLPTELLGRCQLPVTDGGRGPLRHGAGPVHVGE